MAEEVIQMRSVVATCRTEGCAYSGVPSELSIPDGPGNHIVVCAECGRTIEDVVPA